MYRLVAINKETRDKVIIMDVKNYQLKEVSLASVIDEMRSGNVKMVNIELDGGTIKNLEASNNRIPKYVDTGNNDGSIEERLRLVGDYRATILHTLVRGGDIVGYKVLNHKLRTMNITNEDAIKFGDVINYSNAKIVTRSKITYLSAILGEFQEDYNGEVNESEEDKRKLAIDLVNSKNTGEIIKKSNTGEMWNNLGTEKVYYNYTSFSSVIFDLVSFGRNWIAIKLIDSVDTETINNSHSVDRLFRALVVGGVEDICRALIENGYDIHKKGVFEIGGMKLNLNIIDRIVVNRDGEGYPEVVIFKAIKLLIKLGCKISEGEHSGSYCLYNALENGHYKVAKLIVAQGIDINLIHGVLMRELLTKIDISNSELFKQMDELGLFSGEYLERSLWRLVVERDTYELVKFFKSNEYRIMRVRGTKMKYRGEQLEDIIRELHGDGDLDAFKNLMYVVDNTWFYGNSKSTAELIIELTDEGSEWARFILDKGFDVAKYDRGDKTIIECVIERAVEYGLDDLRADQCTNDALEMLYIRGADIAKDEGGYNRIIELLEGNEDSYTYDYIVDIIREEKGE